MARDYKREYELFQGTEKQKKRRAKRNAARRKLMKLGRVSKGDGKDVAHRDNNPNNNSTSNLAVQSKNQNRSFPRNSKNGHR